MGNAASSGSQLTYPIERARLLEEIRGTRDDLEFHVTMHLPHRVTIQLDDRLVVTTDNQQRRRSFAFFNS